MAANSDITLYTSQTPNGIKASILLEELGLPYKVHALDLSKYTQKEEWFLEINPNGRIPALTDKGPDGKPLRLFESGSIMQYLTETYDKDHKVSYPRGTPEYWEMTNWLMWQIGGLGPMQGQLNHFNRYAPEKIKYGIDRYNNESRRLYRAMDKAIAANPSGCLVGDRVTIADISCWGWVACHTWSGVDIEEFPNVKKWLYKMLERPGFEKGRHVPIKHTAIEMNELSEEELEKKAAAVRVWVQAGMKADAEK